MRIKRVSRGNREEKGSIETVRQTQLSIGCAVSVVAGGGKILGNVTNVAGRAAQAVVGRADVVGAQRALADRTSDRTCSLARYLADRTSDRSCSLDSFTAAFARARSRASAFCFISFCTKRHAAPTGGSCFGRCDTDCDCVIAAGAGVSGGEINSRGTGAGEQHPLCQYQSPRLNLSMMTYRHEEWDAWQAEDMMAIISEIF
jgi:hypothetical protein